jgi:microcystin-dependent protein
MSEAFVAEIRILPYTFAPTGWASCNGQILPISQNTALFSLLGTYYGGDGKSNFALPDLQGSAAMGTGQGPGLSDRVLGEAGGSTAVTLLESEMPAHTHALQSFDNSLAKANTSTPGPTVVFARANNSNPYQPTTGQQPATMSNQAISVDGGSQPHNNMQPYLTLGYCIALQGIFPQRP